MRITEERYIKDCAEQWRSYAARYPSAVALYDRITDFSCEPLQELSRRGDMAYFERMLAVLNAIEAIVMHPRVANRREAECTAIWQKD